MDRLVAAERGKCKVRIEVSHGESGTGEAVSGVDQVRAGKARLSLARRCKDRGIA